MKSTALLAALLLLATTTLSATYGSDPTCSDDDGRVSASAMLQTKQFASKMAMDLATDESLQGDVTADDVQVLKAPCIDDNAGLKAYISTTCSHNPKRACHARRRYGPKIRSLCKVSCGVCRVARIANKPIQACKYFWHYGVPLVIDPSMQFGMAWGKSSRQWHRHFELVGNINSYAEATAAQMAGVPAYNACKARCDSFFVNNGATAPAGKIACSEAGTVVPTAAVCAPVSGTNNVSCATSDAAACCKEVPAWVGCYKDGRDRDFKVNKGSGKTIATCADACSAWHYFGMQNYGECWCGDAVGTKSTYVKVADSECGSPCKGETMPNVQPQLCGMAWRNAVYTTKVPYRYAAQKGYADSGGHKWLHAVLPKGSGVGACYEAVMADGQCAKDYFTYVARGDQNCGCNRALGNKISNAANSDIYQIIVRSR